MDEREIFRGSENRLILKQTYTHEFQCVYSLDNYPFDKQTCSIDMTTSELDSSTLRLFPMKLSMEQERDMTLFHMDYWDLNFRNKSAPEEGVSMTIVRPRRWSIFQSDGMVNVYFQATIDFDGFSMVLTPLDHHH